MPREYNQKVIKENKKNKKNNKLLAETIIWVFVDKYLLVKRFKDIMIFYIYFIDIFINVSNIY